MMTMQKDRGNSSGYEKRYSRQLSIEKSGKHVQVFCGNWIRAYAVFTSLICLFAVICPWGHAQVLTPSRLNITEVVSSHRAPYLLEYTVSLRDLVGNAVVDNPDNFRLTAIENERELNRIESGAVILPSINKTLDSVVIVDYSGSMSSLFSNGDNNQNGISDSLEHMEGSVGDLFRSLNEDATSTLVEIHNELSDPSVVAGPSSDSEAMIESLTGIRSQLLNDFSGSTRIWDALQSGVNALAGSPSSNGRRYLVFYSDGVDESSTVDPIDLAQQAKENGIKLYSVLYNKGEPLSGANNPLNFIIDVDADVNAILPSINTPGPVSYLSGEAQLVVSRDALQKVPDTEGFEFFGPDAGLMYMLKPDNDVPEPYLSFAATENVINNTDTSSIDIQLEDFSGPGDFWLYQTDAGSPPNVLVNTHDGIGDEDAFQIASADSISPTMVFSEAGEYQITFLLSTTLNNGQFVESRFRIPVSVSEDVNLVEQGALNAKFVFDGTIWTQTVVNGTEEIDTLDSAILVGPESQVVIDDPADYPFANGSSIFQMGAGGGGLSLGLDLSEVLQGVFVDENVQIKLSAFDGPGDMYVWESDPNALSFDTSDGVDDLDVVATTSANAVSLNWAFSGPGDYKVTLMATALLIDPNEPSEGMPIEFTIRVVEDFNVLLVNATGGQSFTSKNAHQLNDIFNQAVINLQGNYAVRWSTLKRGTTPFVPSFTIQFGGNKATFEAEEVIPVDLDGSILEAQLAWDMDQLSGGGSDLVLESNYIPRNFQGMKITYATVYGFEVDRVEAASGGIIPEGWEIIRTESNGVGTIEVKGPVVNGRPATIPFNSVGRLLYFRFNEEAPINQLFYEFSFEVSNSANTLNFPDELEILTPRTETVYGTNVDWLRSFGITGDIPELVVAERSDLDGDGVPTWLEYQYGSNPLDGSRFFQFFPISSLDGQPLISFTSERFRQYILRTSSNLIDWEISQLIPGTGDIIHLAIPLNEGEDAGFFQLTVDLPSEVSIDVVLDETETQPQSSWLTIEGNHGTYIAGGVDGALAALLPESSAWLPVDSPTSQSIRDFTYFNEHWYAVGNGGVILKSADGVDWELVDAPQVPFLWSIANNGSLMVAVGYRGGILTSNDGISWSERSLNTPDFLRSIIWDGSRFIAVGAQGKILISANGSRWNTLSSPTSNALYDVAASGGQYVLVGANGTLLAGDNLDVLSPVALPASDDLSSIVWSNGRFVTATESGSLFHSQFGNVWTQQNAFLLPADPDSEPDSLPIPPIRSIHTNPDGTILKTAGPNNSLLTLQFRLTP